MTTRGKWGAVKDRDPQRAEEIYSERQRFEYSAIWHRTILEYSTAVGMALDKEPNKNLLKQSGPDFVSICEKYGVDPVFALAVALHETGHGTSNYLKKYNNAFGIQPKGEDGAPAPYASVAASIEAFCKLIAGPYFRAGQTTVIDITDQKGNPEGHCYCGEHHDSVSRLDWIEGITGLINKIWENK